MAKTKYILNSGGLRNNIPEAKKFVAEMLKGQGNEPKVLFCFFAHPREEWEGRFAEYVKGFKDWLSSEVNPKFELAFPATFKEQIEKCDVLYIHGGDDHLLKYWLSQFDLPAIWQGKVVATNSASTNALAKSFWTCDWRQCFDGFGILPIKVIPHYLSDYGSDDPRGPIDWQKAFDDLKNYGDPTLQIYALKEGEFEIFEENI